MLLIKQKNRPVNYCKHNFNTFQKYNRVLKLKNIAGRLPENSRNRFVDRQFKKDGKKTDQKIRLFIEG